MSHVVKADGRVFEVPGGAVRHALSTYIPQSGPINYETLKGVLKGEEISGHPSRRHGYIDFDAMEKQGLREPVCVGGYEFLLKPTISRIRKH